MEHPRGERGQVQSSRKVQPGPRWLGSRAPNGIYSFYAGTFFGCCAGAGFAGGIPASISASSSAARGPATIMPTRCWVSPTEREAAVMLPKILLPLSRITDPREVTGPLISPPLTITPSARTSAISVPFLPTVTCPAVHISIFAQYSLMSTSQVMMFRWHEGHEVDFVTRETSCRASHRGQKISRRAESLDIAPRRYFLIGVAATGVTNSLFSTTFSASGDTWQLPTNVAPSAITSFVERTSPRTCAEDASSIRSDAVMLPLNVPSILAWPTVTSATTEAPCPKDTRPLETILPSIFPSMRMEPSKDISPLIETSEPIRVSVRGASAITLSPLL